MSLFRWNKITGMTRSAFETSYDTIFDCNSDRPNADLNLGKTTSKSPHLVLNTAQEELTTTNPIIKNEKL